MPGYLPKVSHCLVLFRYSCGKEPQTQHYIAHAVARVFLSTSRLKQKLFAVITENWLNNSAPIISFPEQYPIGLRAEFLIVLNTINHPQNGPVDTL